MEWVEKQLIHKDLSNYRPNPRREIFEVFAKFSDSIDYSVWDIINGLNIANDLAKHIDGLLIERSVRFRRWYLNDLEDYDVSLRKNM